MRNTRTYSLLKAISWRIFATVITIVISFYITHKLDFAIYIGAFEFIAKILFYYAHERMWESIMFRFSKFAS